MQKPITLIRLDYINSILNATQKSGLPAFIIVDVLERILDGMRLQADKELKRDEIEWRKAQAEKDGDKDGDK